MVRMIDVGQKENVCRVAVAEGLIRLSPSTIDQIRRGKVKKGDVIVASKLAGIQAAKATSSILPLCHQIPLTSIDISAHLSRSSLKIRCEVSACYKTGVEMEALVGVTAALLNVWDMVKYLEKDSDGQYPLTRVSGIKVLSKSKGGARSGRR